MPAALAVRGLVKRYAGPGGPTTAVDGLDLAVEAGTVLALLGPNGAGKTTTVECLAGFRRPDAGTVSVLGLDPVADRPAVVAQLGVMLQEAGAYQAAGVREVLALHAAFHADPLEVEALLAQVGLAAAARQRVRSLSGGQRQRLNLALALVGRPRVLLLDEPTAGMDPEFRQATWALVRRLRDDGATVLLTTHHLEEAERLADVVAVLDRGRLVACDSPAALLAAGARGAVVVTTSAAVDAAALAAAVGAPVRADGVGRYVVEADAEAIPAVTAWFAAAGLPLTGVTTAPGGLEDVYLRLTGAPEAR